MNGWEIKGILYNCTARTNEEYKDELKKRQRLMIVLLFLGILTLVAMAVLLLTEAESSENYAAGFFCGAGIGLILGAGLGIQKLHKTMNDEAALKEARLTETDEREKEISNRALKMTAKILLISIYLLLLLCVITSIDAATILYFLLAEFILSYLVSRRIYSKLL